MNIKPMQVYMARNGNYVCRFGSGYIVYTYEGKYIGETMGLFDSFTMADRGEP